jgi:regulator of RNase E activity RraA
MSDDAIRETLARIPTATVADILRKHAPHQFIVQGARPMTPISGSIAGPVRTLRFLPPRSDVKAPPSGNARMKLIGDVKPGEIMVFDTQGGPGPVVGDMVAYGSHVNGCAAIVTDGYVRDTAAIAEFGLPVFARGYATAPNAATVVGWDIDIPVQCGGALVLPGDWMIADAEAALVIPRGLVAELADGFEPLAEEERFIRLLMDQGQRIIDVFPLPASLRPLYERYREDGRMPPATEVTKALGGKS